MSYLEVEDAQPTFMWSEILYESIVDAPFVVGFY